MRRLLKLLGWLLLIVILAIPLALGAFRYLASQREVLTPQAAAAGDGRFVRAGGLAIHYREWGSADGEPLLLMPGSFAWSETFRDIAVPLGERGWRVIGIDMPPFGYSERPVDHDYSRDAQAGRLLDLADALGIERFVLGVHSYGGGAAIEAAFIAPERIRGLVLLDVALGLGREGEGGLPLAPVWGIDLVRNAITPATFTNPMMIGKGLRDFIYDDAIVTPERIEIYARPANVAGTTEAVGRWLLTGLFADERRSYAADRANYRAFKPPVLVIWGRQDTVTPLTQGEEIAALFSKSKLVVLDGVNHIPQVEAPQETTTHIDAFMAEIRRSEAGLMGATDAHLLLKGSIDPQQ